MRSGFTTQKGNTATAGPWPGAGSRPLVWGCSPPDLHWPVVLLVLVEHLPADRLLAVRCRLPGAPVELHSPSHSAGA